MVRKDGTMFPVLFNATAIKDKSGRYTMSRCTIFDISERKEAEAAIRQAHDQAVSASKFKSEFLANMSHEIRTPMNGILGMAEMLLRSNLEERQRGFALTIHEAGKSLLAVINDILDFSKIEAGKLTIEIAEFEPVRLVESVAELLADQARKKQLSLLTFIDPRIPLLMRGDPGRLRQILMNFAGNAIKFSDKGEVLISAVVESEQDDSMIVKLSVSDTGIGMTPEELSKLFQPFVQVDGSITRKYGGTGLGLSICKRLVELLGGELGVQSTKGEGSKFWFTVPLLRAPNVQNVTRIAQDIAKMRVLVVDDEETSREVLYQYIESWGMRGNVARNADEALELLRESATSDPYSIALVDLFMSGTNGFQLGQIIREEDQLRRMKLILVTAYDNPGAGEEAITLGFDAFLTKPIKQSQLLDCITTVVSGSHQREFAASSPLVATTTREMKALPPPEDRHELLLVVEDHSINQEVALLLLKDLGFEAHVAQNGRHALELMERSTYALIFMDCQMPEMDGFAATAAIRKSEARTGKHIPIVAMTAHAVEGSKEQCLAAGMSDYISKPIDPDQLQSMLEKWLPLKGSSEKSAEPHSAPLDMEALSSRYGKKNVDRLIQAFMKDAPRQVEELHVYATDENSAGVLATAHGLKGICGTVFAKRMRETCIDIEGAGRAKEWNQVRTLVARLKAEFTEVENCLKQHAS
jgi:polar amino acid transport system substrate-binding protein